MLNVDIFRSRTMKELFGLESGIQGQDILISVYTMIDSTYKVRQFLYQALVFVRLGWKRLPGTL
jgi:hypothetical protein